MSQFGAPSGAEPPHSDSDETMSGPIDLARVRAALAGASSAVLERSRRAAVAVVLSQRDAQLAVLLVRRSEREG